MKELMNREVDPTYELIGSLTKEERDKTAELAATIYCKKNLNEICSRIVQMVSCHYQASEGDIERLILRYLSMSDYGRFTVDEFCTGMLGKTFGSILKEAI